MITDSSATSFRELFESTYSPEKFEAGSIVTAVVTNIKGDLATVDAGMKSESVIQLSEFRDISGEVVLSIGDEVEVYVENLVDIAGNTNLSRSRAQLLQTWKRLEEAMSKEETVTGIVTNRVRGGLSLDVGQVRAFLPRSLIGLHQVQNLEEYEGEKLQVKVLKLDAETNNLVVSRRAVLEEENRAEKETLLSSLNEGDIVEGTVKNLTSYGAFIDMGGTDGLLHITDMAWKRINHPSELVSGGDRVEVRILKLDRENFRVSLGMKQLVEDPWKGIEERYPIGTIANNATISSVVDYGAFVSIEDAIEGLVHTSELDWKSRNIHPSKIVQVGDKVAVKVLSIDLERRRISLSIKQCQESPWVIFARNHKRGDIVKGKVCSITDFGLFVGLEEGIDGLVHLSDLCRDGKPEDELSKYKKNDPVEAQILSIFVERERVSLGIKQLTQDNFMKFVDSHSRSNIYEATVAEPEDGVPRLQLAEGVFGFFRKSESLGDLSERGSVRVAVTSIDRKNRKVFVSLKDVSALEEKQNTKDYAQRAREQEKTMDRSIGTLFDNLESPTSAPQRSGDKSD